MKPIKLAVELSSKYINDRFLPDKAIDIIDEAGSYISMNREDSNEKIIDEKIIEEVISKSMSYTKEYKLKKMKFIFKRTSKII